jgi:hypothetical protein
MVVPAALPTDWTNRTGPLAFGCFRLIVLDDTAVHVLIEKAEYNFATLKEVYSIIICPEPPQR